MAYNNTFPIGYNPYPYQMLQNQQMAPQAVSQTQQAPQQPNSIIWVQGEAGAKSYLVAPNNTVQLWDSEAQTIYLKSADASGMPSMKILDYKIREANQPTTPKVIENEHQYAEKETVDALSAEIERLRAEIEFFKASVANTPKEAKKREKSDL